MTAVTICLSNGVVVYLQVRNLVSCTGKPVTMADCNTGLTSHDLT